MGADRAERGRPRPSPRLTGGKGGVSGMMLEERAVSRYHMAGRYATPVRDSDNVPLPTRALVMILTVLVPVDGELFVRELRVAQSGSGEVLDWCDVRWAPAPMCTRGELDRDGTRNRSLSCWRNSKVRKGQVRYDGLDASSRSSSPGLTGFHLARREISSKVTDMTPLCSGPQHK